MTTTNERMSRLMKNSLKNWGDGSQHAEGDVTFYKVGRNASHDFYVGQMGNFFLGYSIGEDWDKEGNEILKGHLTAYQSFDELMETAYLGHL